MLLAEGVRAGDIIVRSDDKWTKITEGTLGHADTETSRPGPGHSFDAQVNSWKQLAKA